VIVAVAVIVLVVLLQSAAEVWDADGRSAILR